jgi:hypothetical protein
VRVPDLLGQPVELGEVLFATHDLLAPSFDVDREDLVEVLGGDLDPVEVELVADGDDE